MMLPVLNLVTEEICEQHLMLELQPPKLLSSLGIHIIVDFFTMETQGSSVFLLLFYLISGSFSSCILQHKYL